MITFSVNDEISLKLKLNHDLYCLRTYYTLTVWGLTTRLLHISGGAMKPAPQIVFQCSLFSVNYLKEF